MLTPSDVLDLALQSADRQVPAFPIAVSWNEEHRKTAKRPLTPHGHLDATADVDEVRQLFSVATSLRDGEVLGYGQRPGPAGFVVFDADQHPGSPDGVAFARDVLRLPPHTFTVATAAGDGRHYWLRKRDTDANVKSTSPWDKQGVDIRADNGWVVGVGTLTPWGSWTQAPSSPDWGSFAMVPEDKWRALVPSGSASQQSTATRWSRYDPALHDSMVHPLTLKALQIVRAEGGDVLSFRQPENGEPYFDITCGGGGTTATLGFVGPGVLYVFSANWPGRAQGAHDLTLQPFQVDLTVTADADRDLFDLEVRREAHRLRVLEAARERVRAESVPPSPPFDMGTVAEVAARPQDEHWRIPELLQADGNATIVAQRKTGKTTLGMGLGRCLLTGEDFLGRFPVTPLDGRVAFLNFEVSAHQIARWAVEAGVPDDRVVLVNLRGRRNPFAHTDDLDALAQALRSHEVQAIMVDPFGRAFPGDSPNDNGQVGSWLALLDQFGEAVGSEHLIVAVHAGWSGDHSRGASALEDWPDTIMRLKRDDDAGHRYFSAVGRDVEVEEDRLDFDPVTRLLTLSGAGSLRVARQAAHLDTVASSIRAALESTPGLTVTQLTDDLRTRGVGLQRGDVSTAASRLESLGLVERRKVGRSVQHFLIRPDESRRVPTGLINTSRPVPLGRDVLQDASGAIGPEVEIADAVTLVQSTFDAEVVA